MKKDRVIYKFGLASNGRTNIDVPKGAKVLSVQNQRQAIQLWALCDPNTEDESRTFIARLTGHAFANLPGEFVGTVQLYGGRYVAHVFEVKK